MKIITEEMISSQHHLPYYEGKCKNKHGHNWRIVVMIDGDLLEEGPHQGMVMDFVDIKKIIMTYDHVNLNELIVNPTAELIALKICEEIYVYGLKQGNIRSVLVRIYETPKSFVECTSEDYTWTIDKPQKVDEDVGDGSNP